MNRSVAWLTTALMMLPQAAWAQRASAAPTINPQASLAPGEVLAQVAASGAVHSKPDLAIFRVTVVARLPPMLLPAQPPTLRRAV